MRTRSISRSLLTTLIAPFALVAASSANAQTAIGPGTIGNTVVVTSSNSPVTVVGNTTIIVPGGDGIDAPPYAEPGGNSVAIQEYATRPRIRPPARAYYLLTTKTTVQPLRCQNRSEVVLIVAVLWHLCNDFWLIDAVPEFLKGQISAESFGVGLRLGADAAATVLPWEPTSACGAPLWMKMVAARADLSEPSQWAIVRG